MKVLVVDDEPSIRFMLERIVTAEGWKVQVAADGLEAWSYLNVDELPDMVLLDVSMPVMTGLELYAKMQATPSLARLPVIFVSGAPDQVPAGALLIVKPFLRDQLVQAVRAVAGGPPALLTNLRERPSFQGVDRHPW